MKDKMMNDKHETITQARKALDSVTENIIGVERVDVDKDFCLEDGTASLTITVDYRTDIEQVIPTPKQRGICKELLEESMKRAINQHVGIDEK